MKKILIFLATTVFSAQAMSTDHEYSIHVNPVQAINRTLTTEAFFPYNSQISYGPAISLEYADFKTTENYHYVFGFRVNKHFSEVYKTGGYVSAQASYAYIENIKNVGSKTYSRQGHDFRLTSLIGYLWRYENFIFNVAIGGGLTSFGHPKKVTETGEEYEDTISFPDIPLILDGDFSIGWVFD